MIYRITYYGDNGTIYSFIDDWYDHKLNIGEWDKPFPNEEGNSTAFGLCECLAQDEKCPPEFYEGVEIVKVKVEEYKNE